jgi:hypothetical protein
VRTTLPLVGHRQVTDLRLPALARARGGRVATFDRGFAALVPRGVARSNGVERVE